MARRLGDPADGPLDAEEAQHLLPKHAEVSVRSDVFELEALNIAAARAWLDPQDITRSELLSQAFQHELHRRMYSEVWAWAGQRRVRENNIGVAPEQLVEKWEQLLRNVDYWLVHDVFPADEACIKYYFEQRELQPFHDGNSRLMRIVANKLAQIEGLSARNIERYPFGRGGDPELVRVEYLTAIRAARGGNLQTLIDLARRRG